MPSVQSLALGAALLAGLTSSCGDSLAGGPQPTIPELMQSIQLAPQTTAFQGTRRVKIDHSLEGTPIHLEYTELVSSDGAGQFSIQTQDVVDAGRMDPFLFQQMQDARAGFFWRYRDFGVKDWQLFTANWQATDLGKSVLVAGRVSWELSVERKTGSNTRYQIAVDLNTGLILRCLEFHSHGNGVEAQVASFEFESIDFAPVFTVDHPWHQPSNAEQWIVQGTDIEQQLGFSPLSPKLPPAGYQLLEVSYVQEPTAEMRRWLKLTYTDGIDSAFFLFGQPASMTGETSTEGYVGGPSGAGVAPNNSLQDNDEAIYLNAGSVTAVEAHIGGYDFIGVGKVDVHDLLVMIQSALP